LGVEAFAEGVLVGEVFELGDELAGLAVLEVVVDAVFEGVGVVVFELAAGVVGEAFVLELDEWCAAPEGERSVWLALSGEVLETVGVELVGVELELVAGLAGEQASFAELFAEVGDGVLEDLGGGGWRFFAPELVDQPFAGDDLVGVQQQVGQQRLLLATADGDRPPVIDDLHRTEDAEIHATPRGDGNTVRGACLDAELPVNYRMDARIVGDVWASRDRRGVSLVCGRRGAVHTTRRDGMSFKVAFSRLVGVALVVAALTSGTAYAETAQGLKADGLRLTAIARSYEQNRPAASFYSPQALKAEGLRWTAMAKAYQDSQPVVQKLGSSAGFNWGDAGVGLAGGLAFSICAAALIIAARRGKRTKLVL
jgi:hypothetical protein